MGMGLSTRGLNRIRARRHTHQPDGVRPESGAVPGEQRVAGGRGRAIVRRRTEPPALAREGGGASRVPGAPDPGVAASSPCHAPRVTGRRDGIVSSGRLPRLPHCFLRNFPSAHPAVRRVPGGRSWARLRAQPQTGSPVPSREKAPNAGCRAEAQRRVEEKQRRRKGGEGERGAGGRGNSRLRRANGNCRTRWHQIPFGQ